MSCEPRVTSNQMPGSLTARCSSLATQSAATAKLPPYLVLLRVGFALPATLLPRRYALTAPFHPYPCGRYVFCGTFRRSALTLTSRTLSGTQLYGVRTFLPRHLTRRERPSGPAAYGLIIVECFPNRSSPGATTWKLVTGERSSDLYEAAPLLL